MCLPQQLSLPTQFLINLSHPHKYTPAFKTLSKAWCVSLWHGNHNSYIKGILLRSYCHLLLLYVLSVFLQYDGQWVSGPTEHPLYVSFPLFIPAISCLRSAHFHQHQGFPFHRAFMQSTHTHNKSPGLTHLINLYLPSPMTQSPAPLGRVFCIGCHPSFLQFLLCAILPRWVFSESQPSFRLWI